MTQAAAMVSTCARRTSLRRLKLAHEELTRPRVGPDERSRLKLVRRAHALTIPAARVITVPAPAILSALVFLIVPLLAA